MSKPNTSRFGRAAAIAGLAGRLAGQEARARAGAALGRASRADPTGLLEARMAQARTVAESLGRLKGAVMKAGQLLSVDAADFLPPEAVEILGSLQGEAEPVAFEAVDAVLREELGEAYPRLEGLNPTPFASASIGQVHAARVDGVEVAVKVQYPGVARCIDADLAVLSQVARRGLTLSGRKMDLDPLLEELRQVLHQEVDYAAERRFLEAYRARLGDDPRFRVPEAFEALSTARVLTMTREAGLPVRAWLARDPAPAARTWVAHALLELYCLEFFRWGLVQTDPNPANFLIQDAPERLVLLDFGVTLTYEAAFREAYVRLLRVIGAGRTDAIVATGEQMGLLDPREGKEAKEAFAELLRSATEPFCPEKQPFEFAARDYERRAREVGRRFLASLKYSPPPRKLVFLHRKLGGLFNLLKRMDVRLDLYPYWAQMVGTELAGPSTDRPAGPIIRA